MKPFNTMSVMIYIGIPVYDVDYDGDGVVDETIQYYTSEQNEDGDTTSQKYDYDLDGETDSGYDYEYDEDGNLVFGEVWDDYLDTTPVSLNTMKMEILSLTFMK